MKRRDHPNQLSIDWANPHQPAGRSRAAAHPVLIPNDPSVGTPAPLIQRLPWDFVTTFPQPSDAAIDAGILDESDPEPENVKALHEEHAREALVVLRSIDKVLDARRRGVDPTTGRPPAAKEDRDGLQDFLTYELERCQRWRQTLMDTYEEAFGAEATDAFGKAIRARHAGIEVIGDQVALTPKTPVKIHHPVQKPGRVSSVLPVPRPLAWAVKAGHFGHHENGKPVNPEADEVRAITEDHAEKLIELLGTRDSDVKIKLALDMYAEDFGEPAAKQLERYAWRKARDENGWRR